VGFAVGVMLALPGAATASHDPSGAPFNEDFVVGSFTTMPPTFVIRFTIDAHSGPSGENLRGDVTVEADGGSATGRVTCLNVTGNRATVGVDFADPSIGGGFFFVEDNDGGGEDAFSAAPTPTGEPPSVCPTDPSTPPSPISDGGISVHDATAPRVLFGKTTIGSTFSPLDHNDKYGSRYYLFTASPVTVTKLRAYLDGLGRASGSQVLRGLIYRHTSTGPGGLVARTFQVRLNAGQPPGWVDLYFPFPPRLQAGGYWLTLHAGESENVVRYAFDPKPGGQRHNDDLFSNGPLNPFGGSDRAAKEMSIHAVGR
jgi:hypothetical protein